MHTVMAMQSSLLSAEPEPVKRRNRIPAEKVRPMHTRLPQLLRVSCCRRRCRLRRIRIRIRIRIQHSQKPEMQKSLRRRQGISPRRRSYLRTIAIYIWEYNRRADAWVWREDPHSTWRGTFKLVEMESWLLWLPDVNIGRRR